MERVYQRPAERRAELLERQDMRGERVLDRLREAIELGQEVGVELNVPGHGLVYVETNDIVKRMFGGLGGLRPTKGGAKPAFVFVLQLRKFFGTLCGRTEQFLVRLEDAP